MTTTNSARLRTALVASSLIACGLAASRTPLGGNYSARLAAPSSDRRAPSEAALAAPTDGGAPPPIAAAAPTPPEAPVSASLASVDAGPGPKVATGETLRFEPLRVGSRIQAELTLGAAAEMRGGPPGIPGGGKFSVDARLRAEIRVLKASAQSLDQIELTLTTRSMRSEFAGQESESKQEPPETYEIDLTASPPNIRTQNGSKVAPLGRAKLAFVVVPLAEFYSHWARSPALELKPGWSREVPLPIAVAFFTTTPDVSMRAGPLRARFTARPPASNTVPFELSLPLQYKNDLGTIDFELNGSAHSNVTSGRPTALDLSGPLTASGGPPGSQLSIVGTAKLAGTFSYP